MDNLSKTLDKQVYIYSLGTECFYTDCEYKIHERLFKCHLLKKKINDKLDKFKNKELNESESYRISKLKLASKKVSYFLNKYKEELTSEFKKFNGIRELRNDTLTNNKLIGIFDSALTRTIGIKTDDISDSLIVVRAYYFNILEDIILNGFIHNNEEYIYFSSSAGQIRTKKTVFIKKSLWEKHEATLMCGLTEEHINKNGGCNVNKLLAYKSLISSASIEWSKFDIDRCIVVPDLKSPVTSEFDSIDMTTYEINREEKTVEIEHTDGCGMILPSKSKNSFMTRLPFVKGLLVPSSFDEFAKMVGNTKVKDIYGKEWDIIEDRIEVIFTKSQFKMHKYYHDWADYKDKFKKYNCKANKLNEESETGYATLNYQMIQTLTDVTDNELKELASETNKEIEIIGSDKDTMLRVLGVSKNNKRKNNYQKALSIYPELLNDIHSKKVIRDKKKSMVNDARAGKLRINGKYLYLVPDLYAFCEFLFEGKTNPEGLLSNGEVYTKVFEEDKVDILRSPHLYKEHAIRKVVKRDDVSKWFISNGIYTSIHDPISRILQFDNDGDMGLVIQDKLFTSIAERNMKNIVPLYYEMGVAPAHQINNQEIYDSLILAFKANIGEVSNNITKIFNSDNKIDLDVVKWLTAENNYIIDFAKTLYIPKRPESVDESIREAIKGKVPHFFIEAKNKKKENVEELTKSTMNRLRKQIPNRIIKFADVAGEFDYTKLMSEEIEYVNRKIINRFKELEKEKRKRYRKTSVKESKEGTAHFFKYVRDELLLIESDVDKIVNSLVKEFFHNTNLQNKDTLWNSFGDVIVNNLMVNLKGTKQCEECGARVEANNNRFRYCKDCQVEVDRNKARQRMMKIRNKCSI